ncbi:hypothetical protein CHELA1G11_13128 [Hyphomicrobiales bacterium]|nr:hypothetical protein CHELA1G2_11180 [Hyphomicrobiales bacterium]CAH1669502.1 hypothetical protein CHELA1G11_13128 [Hyphomicrobiales bacterium]
MLRVPCRCTVRNYATRYVAVFSPNKVERDKRGCNSSWPYRKLRRRGEVIHNKTQKK